MVDQIVCVLKCLVKHGMGMVPCTCVGPGLGHYMSGQVSLGYSRESMSNGAQVV